MNWDYHKRLLQKSVVYIAHISVLSNVIVAAFLLKIFSELLMLLELKHLNCLWRNRHGT